MARKILGRESKVYKAAAAFTVVPTADVVATAYPTGTFTEYNKVIEVSVDDAKEEADASDRSLPTDQSIAVGRKVSLEVKIHQNPDDAQYQAFNTAYITGAEIGLMITSSDKAVTTRAVEGFAANWTVSGKPREEKLKEVTVVTFKITVASCFGDFLVAAA